MNYEQMSDFDINRLVAINRGGYQGHVAHMQYGVKESDKDSCGMFHFERDYCNNPSDAWPIIAGMVANGCVVQILQAGVVVILQGGGRIQFMDKNPLRAAMIVFLMMQDEAK